MKILIVMDPGILVPPDGYGGIERLVEIFAKEYYKQGHEVHLLVTTGSFVENCTMHNFGKPGFPPKKRDARRALPAAWKFLWKHRDSYDLIHNFGRLAYLLPLINHPVKKIMTYQREIRSRNIRLSNFIKHKNIVYTACSANLLSRVHMAGTWEVVYNAIEFAKYDLTENISDTAPLIFLGRIEKIKGCHTAIKIAKECGERLIIAGNISPLPEEKLYFEQEIQPSIDGDQIKYVGALNDAQKNKYLGEAKALLFPIEWEEPFGIVMIEAMACGTPVIGYNMGSVPEVVEDGITGFVVSSLSEMKKRIGDLHLIDRGRCRERAFSRFNSAVVGKQYLDLFVQKKKIVIITSGQPSANPRAVKEATSLSRSGYDITVIYVPLSPWANEFDKVLFKTYHKIKWLCVGYDSKKNNVKYIFVRARRKLYEWKFRYLNRPGGTYENALVLYAPELKRHARKIKGDLYIAHNLGALPAAVLAAKKWNAPVGFDAEDFHRGETSEGSLYLLASKIEDKYIPGLDYLTAASPLIADKYAKLYPGVNVLNVNNAFSKKFIQPVEKHPKDEMRLFWFSQIVGIERGLENVIEALNELVSYNISIYLLGNCTELYRQQLVNLSKKPGSIHFLEPVPPDDIFSTSAQYDIGLATEVPHSENRKICLTNKLYTYVLAGNCIVASDTPAQKKFMEENPDIGVVYKSDDPASLATELKDLYENKVVLQGYRETAHSLASRNLNWETEFQKLAQLINEKIN